jgi:hypothetical protein
VSRHQEGELVILKAQPVLARKSQEVGIEGLSEGTGVVDPEESGLPRISLKKFVTSWNKNKLLMKKIIIIFR